MKHDSEAVWAWFQLHSNQRMQLVSFWLAGTALLASALVATLDKRLTIPAIGISFLGALSSSAFALLDARTRQLVKIAEDQFANLLEEDMKNLSYPTLIAAAAKARKHSLISYRFLIEGLEATTAIAFLLGGVWAWLSA